MLAPVEAAFQATLPIIIADWPIRFANLSFDGGVRLSEGGLPVDARGKPLPFVDAMVIGGADHSAAGSPNGSLSSQRSGLFRIYLSVGQGTGTRAITLKSDAVVAGFKRQTIFADASLGQRLIAMDPRVDDGVAAYQDAGRFVRMISIPWDFDYRI